METTEKLIRVTPQELSAVFDRLEAEPVTRLAIAGSDTSFPADANRWPNYLQFQLSEWWWALVDRVIQLRHLNGLVLLGLKLGDFGARAIAEHLTQLTSLDVGNNRICEAGARAIAEHLTQLTSLNVCDNQIGEAGARAIAEHLTQLTSLNVCNNQIGEAGARAIAEHLTQLTSLNADDTDVIDAEFGDVNIGDAGARAIAESLTELQVLSLDGNSVGQPTIDELGKRLRRLTNLSIARNKDVRDIGPLADLAALRRLDVTNTSVSDLGPFADRIADGWPVRWDWSNEDGLFVAGCPLVRPTVEIAQQGPEAVRNYFSELAAQGEDFLYEAKVLILGEGGAGKTSLLRRLYQPDLELPREDETTRGIDIHRQDFVGNHGRPFRLNVWDFGGQQIYHATHQFFLTKNSLYLLVDDTRKDDKTIHDEGFKFWLEVVETLSESSPLLIFQNEKGDRSKTIDQAGIQGRFTNVKEVYRGNLDKPGSVKPLQQAIEYFVQQLPHIGERVPKKWVAIREELEQLAVAKPFISQDDYFTVYGRHLQFDRTKALYLSRFLHDLGVFLHFQDDPLLSKTVILQNQWATEAVFRILDDETIKSQRGRFTAADCQRLWAASAYAAMHFELRGLMEKFELCYRLAAPHLEQWVSPQLLLPSKPPELAQWARPDDLVVRFQYPFLPRGLVSRLMVRQHRFVRQLANCWAHGAFFEHNGTEVLVEETAKGNEIELRARGPEHKSLLSVLSSDLEALNDSFNGLQGRVEKLVPCLCATCRQTTAPEMFEHSLLVKRQHGGKKKTIECRKSEEDVSLLELLDGLKLEHLPPWATKPTQPEAEAEPSKKATTARTKKSTTARKGKNKIVLTTIKIFLASSVELKDDRDEFDLYFRQQNDHLKEQGVYLEIIRWENFLDSMSKTRLQDEYNKALRDCDIVVSLFKTKVGKFTEVEFDEALKEFKVNGKPKIFTFFRDFQMTNDERRAMQADLASLDRFQQKLSDLDHCWTRYKDSEHLKRQFRDQLTHLGVLN